MLEKLSSHDKEEFKRIGNRLLGNCFLCKKNEAARKDYYFVSRYKEVFNDYFAPLGFRIEINDTYGVVQLVNSFGINRLNLKLFESIVLLIVRLLYDEKKRELSLANEVMLSVGEVQEKFMALKIRDKLIDRTTLGNTFKVLKRLNLIELLDKDMTREESQFIVYDSILMAVRLEDIKEIYDKLNSYRRGGDESEEISEDEVD